MMLIGRDLVALIFLRVFALHLQSGQRQLSSASALSNSSQSSVIASIAFRDLQNRQRADLFAHAASVPGSADAAHAPRKRVASGRPVHLAIVFWLRSVVFRKTVCLKSNVTEVRMAFWSATMSATGGTAGAVVVLVLPLSAAVFAVRVWVQSWSKTACDRF